MKKPRIILIGMDGMDFGYASNMLDKLPNINRLTNTGLFKPFKSVFPPDSIPSWITAYTGKDPSEHGILESVDYLAKGDDVLKVDTTPFKGCSFWDYLGKNGNDVCIINPFMAYPVWQVNGVMINGPVFITGDVQVSNPKITEGIEIPNSLGGITDFPNKKTLRQFCDKIFADTEEQMNFGINLLKKNKPQIFFQVFLTMDRIQHFLWRYCDPADPTYPGENQYEEIIEEFYIFADRVIGNFLDSIAPEDQLIVISDHGHGMRCTNCFNLNEYLRRKELLFSSAKSAFSKGIIVEKLKNFVLNFMNKYDLEDYLQFIVKFVPKASSLKKGKHITNNNKNIAYASDFAGTNPFGGIAINKDLVDDYEEFRLELIEDLKLLKYKDKPVFLWVKNRESVYTGKYLKQFPDILFSMDHRLGVAWNLHTDLFTINPTHKKISGGHKEYGVLIMNHIKSEGVHLEELEMRNLFPTLLDYFGMDYQKYCNGKSFIK